MFQSAALAGSKSEQYAELARAGARLLHGERDRVANAANLSALVYHALPQLNWVGFYFYDGSELVVGPFQGQPACVRIALGKGVCGTAADAGARSASPTSTLSPATSLRFRLAFANWSCRCSTQRRADGRVRPRQPGAGPLRREDQRGLEHLAAVFVESLR
jgi:GAF domain-containing protein